MCGCGWRQIKLYFAVNMLLIKEKANKVTFTWQFHVHLGLFGLL